MPAQDRREAVLQRKKKRKTALEKVGPQKQLTNPLTALATKYGTERHQVEGFKMPSYQRSLTWGKVGGVKAVDQSKAEYGYKETGASMQRGRAAEQQLADFSAKQQARSRLRTIADPEAGETQRRKKAARRRMRGRMGTILSQGKSDTTTLGGTSKLG